MQPPWVAAIRCRAWSWLASAGALLIFVPWRPNGFPRILQIWFAMLLRIPECVITKQSTDIKSVELTGLDYSDIVGAKAEATEVFSGALLFCLDSFT